MKNKSSEPIRGIIVIDAKLIIDLKTLEGMLRNAGQIKLLSTGTSIECTIGDSKTVVSFLLDKVKLSYCLSENLKRDYAINLLKLIALLEQINGAYEVFQNSLFRCLNTFLSDYIAPEICSPPSISNPELLITRIDQLSEMNAALFEEVNTRDEQHAKISFEVEILKDFSRQIIKYISGRIRFEGISISNATGIDGKLISNVELILAGPQRKNI